MRAEEVTGVILAGGLSTRMGRDKALLPVAGKPLIRHLAEGMLALGIRRIVVACGTEERGRDYGNRLQGLHQGLTGEIAFAADRYPGCGPLAGLHAALSAMPEDGYAFVMACDMPMVSAPLFARLLRAADESEGAGCAADAWSSSSEASAEAAGGAVQAAETADTVGIAAAASEFDGLAAATRAAGGASRTGSEAMPEEMAFRKTDTCAVTEEEAASRQSDTARRALHFPIPQVVLTPNQPFHALYHTSASGELERRLERSDLRVMSLLGALRTMRVAVSEEEGASAFVNLNTPELYERFARRSE